MNNKNIKKIIFFLIIITNIARAMEERLAKPQPQQKKPLDNIAHKEFNHKKFLLHCGLVLSGGFVIAGLKEYYEKGTMKELFQNAKSNFSNSNLVLGLLGGFSIKAVVESGYLYQEYPEGTYYLKKDFNTFDLSRLQELIKEKISKNNIEIQTAEFDKQHLENLNTITNIGHDDKSNNTEGINRLLNTIKTLKDEKAALEKYLQETSDNLNRACKDIIQAEMANKNADIRSFIDDFVKNIANESHLEVLTIDDLKKQIVDFNNNKEERSKNSQNQK